MNIKVKNMILLSFICITCIVGYSKEVSCSSISKLNLIKMYDVFSNTANITGEFECGPFIGATKNDFDAAFTIMKGTNTVNVIMKKEEDNTVSELKLFTVINKSDDEVWFSKVMVLFLVALDITENSWSQSENNSYDNGNEKIRIVWCDSMKKYLKVTRYRTVFKGDDTILVVIESK